MINLDRPNKINDTTIEIHDYNYNTMMKNTFPILLPLYIRLEKGKKYQVRVARDRYFVFSAYFLDERISKVEDIDDWMLFLITGENSRHRAMTFLRVMGFADQSEEVRTVLMSREAVLHAK